MRFKHFSVLASAVFTALVVWPLTAQQPVQKEAVQNERMVSAFRMVANHTITIQ